MSAETWEGPATFVLSRHSEHTRTVRYKCPVGDREFNYYVPRVLLCAEDEAVPGKIHVEISRSDMPLHEIGFHGRPIRPRTEDDFWEYEIDEDKVNSVRYVVDYEGGRYYLYVPKVVFGALSYPKRLLVWIAVPES